MNILFENPLGSMYGPYFLLFYAIFIIFIIILLAVVKRFLDNSEKSPAPIIANDIDPFEIAYLRGENNELARSAVFALMQKELLEFSDAVKMNKIRRKTPASQNVTLNRIEQITFDWFGSERTTSEVFSPGGLTAQLAAYGDAYKNKLEKQNMLNGADLAAKLNLFKLTALSAICCLGAYKVLAAFAHGRTNVVLIFVMGIVGMFIAYKVSAMPRVSKLGNSYLDKLQTAFSNLKNASNIKPANNYGGAQTAFAGVDPLLLSVGIFGGSVLAGTAFHNFNDAFKKSTVNSGGSDGCGSSCSSSDSSCSSSDSSGSSCGSSCGGGCGGCS